MVKLRHPCALQKDQPPVDQNTTTVRTRHMACRGIEPRPQAPRALEENCCKETWNVELLTQLDEGEERNMETCSLSFRAHLDCSVAFNELQRGRSARTPRFVPCTCRIDHDTSATNLHALCNQYVWRAVICVVAWSFCCRPLRFKIIAHVHQPSRSQRVVLACMCITRVPVRLVGYDPLLVASSSSLRVTVALRVQWYEPL
jgi:hypothetical protein